MNGDYESVAMVIKRSSMTSVACFSQCLVSHKGD